MTSLVISLTLLSCFARIGLLYEVTDWKNAEDSSTNFNGRFRDRNNEFQCLTYSEAKSQSLHRYSTSLLLYAPIKSDVAF